MEGTQGVKLIKSHRDLIVWQQAMALTEKIYTASDTFPKCEDYALKSQIRRAAVSIPSNIAEGSGRSTTKDYLSYLHIAKGSVRELDTQVEIARRVGYIDDSTAQRLREQLASVGTLLIRLISSLSAKAL